MPHDRNPPGSSRPPLPQRDPLGETWPEDPDGKPLTEVQAAYVLEQMERMMAQLPTEEERRYLRERHEEEKRWRAVKAFLREHWPRTAIVLSILGAICVTLLKGLAFLAANNITVHPK